jgi:hypothetical protein
MSSVKLATWLLIATAAILASNTSAGGTKARISELSALDRQFMTQQRDALRDLARMELGRDFTGDRANDLRVLQLLLDRRLVRPNQTRELQAMGVIMGDLLATDLDMHWVIYEDNIGRTRALRYKLTEEYLFPITMISRRREAGNTTPVADVYQKAYDIIEPLRTPLPFQ